MIEQIIWLYAAILVAVYVHEIGHMGEKIKIVKWFPIPIGASMQARFRYGGLIATFLLVVIGWRFGDIHPFIQLVGLVAWIHIVSYLIFGSFNYEPKVPKSMWKYYIFDDVENKYWPIFISLAILIFMYLKDYYVPILLGLF